MKPEFFNKAQKALKKGVSASADAIKTAASGPDDVRRRRLLMISGGAILLVVAVIAVLSRVGGDNDIKAPPAKAQAVSVVAIEPHTFNPHVALNGEARPVRDLQVSAPATGVRILQLLVDEGDYVRQGQPMARLDTTVAQAQIQAAQASVAEAQSAAIRARGEYERAESIRDSGALSTEAIEARRAAATAADARLAAARAQAQEVNGRMQGGYVRAPAAGLVIARTAEIGRSVDGQILFRIAAGNALEVAAQVAESDILALREGQPASFRLVDGSTVQGTLRRLPASIDSRTRTGQALFALPSGSRVRAGMYLRGDAELAPREVLAVPQSSISYEANNTYVYVVEARTVQVAQARGEKGAARSEQQFRVRKVQVALGLRDGDWVEVLSGVTAGQRVVGSGSAFLQDGDQVTPPETPAQPAQATPAPAQQQQQQPTARDEQLRGREG